MKVDDANIRGATYISDAVFLIKRFLADMVQLFLPFPTSNHGENFLSFQCLDPLYTVLPINYFLNSSWIMFLLNTVFRSLLVKKIKLIVTTFLNQRSGKIVRLRR